VNNMGDNVAEILTTGYGDPDGATPAGIQEGDHYNLDNANERIEAVTASANQYVNDMESIRQDVSDENAVTLGTMVGAQLSMTQTETQYTTERASAQKVSAANQAAANDVKKAAG
jgi:hypothetical protein